MDFAEFSHSHIEGGAAVRFVGNIGPNKCSHVAQFIGQ